MLGTWILISGYGLFARSFLPCLLLTGDQITNPAGGFEAHQRSVSNGDYSFTAQQDGKFIYCFSNEHWSATTKEVSFNVHGIVYVPESEMPSDPLEVEGKETPYSRPR